MRTKRVYRNQVPKQGKSGPEIKVRYTGSNNAVLGARKQYYFESMVIYPGDPFFVYGKKYSKSTVDHGLGP